MFHFKWLPVSKGFHFDQLSFRQKQLVNHFEFHPEITTKDALFKNILAYAELNKINIFDYVPLTFVVDVDSHTYSPDLERFVLFYDAIESIMESEDKKDPDYVKKCWPKINQKFLQIGFSKERRAVTHCKPKIAETHFAGKNIWILKPTGFNRGRGVSVFNTMEKLKSLIKYYSDGGTDTGPTKAESPPAKLEPQQAESPEHPINPNKGKEYVKSRTFVIQKYIEKPLLIHERKFDIRTWVLVSHEMKVYFFKEGYIRTSCAPYSIDNEAIDQKDIHLTNNAVQINCKLYGAYEEGNQLSFLQFQVLIQVTINK